MILLQTTYYCEALLNVCGDNSETILRPSITIMDGTIPKILETTSEKLGTISEN